MIDIHNHLLFGVDDGSQTVEKSIKILKKMEEKGYTDVILTPHYIVDSQYDNPKNDNLKRMKILQDELKKNGISINLYLGNEIFIDDKIYDLVDRDIISTLNNTNLLLIELPMSGEYSGYQEFFAFLMSKGYKVVLAHPERYVTFQKDFNNVYEMVKMGVYLQCNIDSMVNKYGPDAKRVLTRLLKENLVSFLATDIHHEKHDYDIWNVAKDRILEIISEKDFKELTEDNPKLLLI